MLRSAALDAVDTTTVKFEGDKALTVGTTYYFQVRGRNTNGNVSAWSDTANAIQRALPGKLQNVTVVVGNAEVTLHWDAPPVGDVVFNYDYRWSTDGGSNWQKWQTTITTTYSHTVTGLSNDVAYSFQVRRGHTGRT